ncbi:MAG: glycosyltransferase [Desulfarculaceae bacterium]
MDRCLIISYAFPPTGGVGVQRVTKFVKYLGRWGWQPVVVTVKNPSVPLFDGSFSQDIPQGAVIKRLPTLEPGLGGESGAGGSQPRLLQVLKPFLLRTLFPDRHVLWLPAALPGALAAARQSQAKVILVSGPPFSSFILGALVSRCTGSPLVLDFRDEWSGFFTQGFDPGLGGRLWLRMVQGLEGRLVRRANRVIANTQGAADRLHKLYGGDAAKYVWIPNGYDAQDFAAHEPAPGTSPQEGRIRILYTGTVFKPRPLHHLWEGFKLLTEEQRSRFRVEVVGRVLEDKEVEPDLQGLEVKISPYQPHQEVVQRMKSTDVLLLTAEDLPGQERMVPAKLYEYMAAQRPVLALMPWGEATRIVEATGTGWVCPPGRPRDLAELLKSWLDGIRFEPKPPPKFFDRYSLAGRLAEVLSDACRKGQS